MILAHRRDAVAPAPLAMTMDGGAGGHDPGPGNARPAGNPCASARPGKTSCPTWQHADRSAGQVMTLNSRAAPLRHLSGDAHQVVGHRARGVRHRHPGRRRQPARGDTVALTGAMSASQAHGAGVCQASAAIAAASTGGKTRMNPRSWWWAMSCSTATSTAPWSASALRRPSHPAPGHIEHRDGGAANVAANWPAWEAMSCRGDRRRQGRRHPGEL